MNKYDVLILSCPKDYAKLPYTILSAQQLLNPQPENYYVVAPDKIIFENIDVITLQDQDVAKFDIRQIKYRNPNWVYQQLIKLFGNITKNDLYLTVDSDLIFNKPINIFPRKFWLGNNQNHQPYFNLIEKLFNFSRVYDHSFICEMMLFDKSVIYDILKPFNYNEQDFFAALCNLIDQQGYKYLLSEYELYGNFCTKNKYGLYQYQQIKSLLSGKFEPYTDEELNELITKYQDSEHDILTFHTWI